MYFIGISSRFIIIIRYAPNPTKAKELFNSNESHKPRPDIVPRSGPNARSI